MRLFLLREELGDGPMDGIAFRRVIERQLVMQTPTKDGHGEHCKDHKVQPQ